MRSNIRRVVSVLVAILMITSALHAYVVFNGDVDAGDVSPIGTASAAAGDVGWNVTKGTALSSPAYYSADNSVIVAEDGTIYAFDASDGTELWSQTISGVAEKPKVDGDFVYVSANETDVYKISATDGTIDWQKDMGTDLSTGRGLSPVAVGTNNVAIVNYANGSMHGLDKTTGDFVWNQTLTQAGVSAYSQSNAEGPVEHSGNAYHVATPGDDIVTSISISDGTVNYDQVIVSDASSSTTGELSVSTDWLAFGHAGNSEYVVHRGNGTLKTTISGTSYNPGSEESVGSEIVGDYVYFGTLDGSNFGQIEKYHVNGTLDSQFGGKTLTGTDLETVNTIDHNLGTIYAGTSDNRFFALDENDGSTKWSDTALSGTPKEGISVSSKYIHLSHGTEHTAYESGVTYAISGTVVFEDGRPVPDGTIVEAYAVKTVNLSTDPGQSAEERAEEIRREISSYDEGEVGYDREIDLNSVIGDDDGLFETAESRYVAVHSTEQWGLERWQDGTRLQDPMVVAPAGESFVMSVWDPTNNPTLQDGTDIDLPGTTVNGTIVVEQLDHRGAVVDTYETRTNKIYGQQRRPWRQGEGDGGLFGISFNVQNVFSTNHHYAEVSFPRGFYRVSAKEGDVSYVISVGDPDENIEMITNDLKDEAGDLTAQAERVQQYEQGDKVIELTTTTYTDSEGNKGVWEMTNVPTDGTEISVQAYSPSAKVFDDPKNTSIQDLRDLAESDSYNNQSFYVSKSPTVTDAPAQNVEVTVTEVGGPPYMDPGRFDSLFDWIEELLKDTGFWDTFTDRFPIASDELEDLFNEYEDLMERNQELEQKYNDLLDRYEDTTGEVADLEDKVRLLEQAINDLRDGDFGPLPPGSDGGGIIGGGGGGGIVGPGDDPTVWPDDPATDDGDGIISDGGDTVSGGAGNFSTIIPFNGDIDPEGVVVTISDIEDGTTEVLDEQYYTVIKNAGSNDEILIEDYPMENGTSQVAIGVTAVSDDGERVGDGMVRLQNPNVADTSIDIDSIAVSTLRPSPDEAVEMEVNVNDESVGIQSVNADVTGPPETVNVTPGPDDDTVEFQTDGEGRYYVTLNITDSEGNIWNERVAFKAFDRNIDQPPSVRMKEGMTGRYALVSDGFGDGEISSEGKTIKSVGVADPDEDPNRGHFYVAQAMGTYEIFNVRVMKRTTENGDAEAVRRNMKVFLHTGEIADDAVIYRNTFDPLEKGEETDAGTVSCEDGAADGCVIASFTNGDGTGSFTVNNNPTIVESAFHWIRLQIPFDLRFAPTTITPNIQTTAGAVTGGVTP